ncbi:HD-GYP domain-containing protein [Candidatus Symbiobacter mobilis]|uniref:HD-GYP domain protein n=1 Tax=Candidatus Symbiobacter mobilis CR TaxID=946483 RepID=U5N5A3_9BURK|nr:hypothetical protein [Candidatus Symbiobacter mobilis]AGX86435.1 HD-GYP domain protein [Candidatus Symbiobacter mobilis CR]
MSMTLIPIDIETIRLNHPLPFSLRTKDGALLAPKGYIIARRSDLDLLRKRRGSLCIDITESEEHHRAYVGKLHDMVREDKELGQIAGTGLSPVLEKQSPVREQDEEQDWFDIQGLAHSVLRDVRSPGFLGRLDKLSAALVRPLRSNPDGTLLALIHLAATELQRYSATHALLVAAVCTLASKDVLRWGEEESQLLFNAALTMNLGMTELHDRMALQMEPPSPEQLRVIQKHPDHSRDVLYDVGVDDKIWIDAVLQHRSTQAGPLAKRVVGERLARMLQRADMLAAKLSPRAARPPGAPAVAMQSCYFDEQRQMDEAGAALIKACGIYSPGTFVKLVNQEIAVVVRRGLNTTMPRVAVLVNRQGLPVGEPIIRETSAAEFRIVSSLAPRDVKVHCSLERLLALVKQGSVERPWW